MVVRKVPPVGDLGVLNLTLQVPFVVFLLHAIPFALMQPFLWRSYRRLRTMPARGWLALALVAFTGGMLRSFDDPEEFDAELSKATRKAHAGWLSRTDEARH